MSYFALAPQSSASSQWQTSTRAYHTTQSLTPNTHATTLSKTASINECKSNTPPSEQQPSQSTVTLPYIHLNNVLQSNPQLVPATLRSKPPTADAHQQYDSHVLNNTARKPLYTTIQQKYPTHQQSKNFKHQKSTFPVNKYNNHGCFGPKIPLVDERMRLELRRERQQAELEALERGNTRNSDKENVHTTKKNRTKSLRTTNDAYNQKFALPSTHKKSSTLKKSMGKTRTANIHAKHQASTEMIQARNLLLQYLTSNDCHLFSEAKEVVAVSDEELDGMVHSTGGPQCIDEIVRCVRQCNDDGRRYESFAALVVDVQAMAGSQSRGDSAKVQQEEKHNDGVDSLTFDVQQADISDEPAIASPIPTDHTFVTNSSATADSNEPTKASTEPAATSSATSSANSHNRRDTGFVFAKTDVTSSIKSPALHPKLSAMNEDEEQEEEAAEDDEADDYGNDFEAAAQSGSPTKPAAEAAKADEDEYGGDFEAAAAQPAPTTTQQQASPRRDDDEYGGDFE